jgi:hypothetical protein
LSSVSGGEEGAHRSHLEARGRPPPPASVQAGEQPLQIAQYLLYSWVLIKSVIYMLPPEKNVIFHSPLPSAKMLVPLGLNKTCVPLKFFLI